MSDGFRIKLCRLHKEYHAYLREWRGEALVNQAPKAVALYSPLSNLFTYNHGCFRVWSRLVLKGYAHPPG